MEKTTTVSLTLTPEKAAALETALEDSRESLGAIVVGLDPPLKETIEESIENRTEATETLLRDFRKQLRESQNGEIIAEEAGIEI